MYLSRLLETYSYYSTRNILSYSTINTTMTDEDGENSVRRMRVIREYDEDNGNFIYSNIKDYNNDSEISADNKYIVTNKYNWYLENRDTYQVRYVPLFITNIKTSRNKLETEVNNENVTKLYECAISTVTSQWPNILKDRNLETIKQTTGDLYLIPSNTYIAVTANYKSSDIPSGITEYNADYHLGCRKNLITCFDMYNDFTLCACTPLYMMYSSNVYYWFNDECFNDLFTILSKLLNKTIVGHDALCEMTVDTSSLDYILSLRAACVNILNSYETDTFADCATETAIVSKISSLL